MPENPVSPAVTIPTSTPPSMSSPSVVNTMPSNRRVVRAVVEAAAVISTVEGSPDLLSMREPNTRTLPSRAVTVIFRRWLSPSGPLTSVMAYCRCARPSIV